MRKIIVLAFVIAAFGLMGLISCMNYRECRSRGFSVTYCLTANN